MLRFFNSDSEQKKISNLLNLHHYERYNLSSEGSAPTLIRFIAKYLIRTQEEITELKYDERVIQNQEFNIEISDYLFLMWNQIVTDKFPEIEISEIEMEGAAKQAATNIISTFNNDYSPSELYEFFSGLSTDTNQSIPLVNEIEISEQKRLEIFDCLKTFEATRNILEHRISILLRHLKTKGMRIESNDLRIRTKDEDLKSVDFSILIGTINEHLNKHSNNLGNEDCMLTKTRFFVKHINCNNGNEQISEVSDEFEAKLIYEPISICDSNTKSQNTHSNDGFLDNTSLEDNDEYEYSKPITTTTSVIKSIDRRVCQSEHTTDHDPKYLFKEIFEIKTGPECKLLTKRIVERCRERPSYPKFINNQRELVDNWYGIVMSIDKFELKYSSIMNRVNFNKFQSMRDEVLSYIRIWEQSKGDL